MIKYLSLVSSRISSNDPFLVIGIIQYAPNDQVFIIGIIQDVIEQNILNYSAFFYFR